MARFHDSRFDPNRFDSTPPDTAWPPYLKQEHAQARFAVATAARTEVTRVHRLQRLRQRPMTAWAPPRNQVNAFPVMKVPWRIWTIRR